MRQKWAVVYPWLRRLENESLNVLDAGCGAGHWSIELGQRNPAWRITGIDRDSDAIEKAEKMRDLTGTTNVTFRSASFLSFGPAEPFDLVLSIASAHYLVEQGDGHRLFKRIYSWLRPDGDLLLLGPRRRADVPFSTVLPWPRWHDVFTAEQLENLCRESGLATVTINGFVGEKGVMAKQLSQLPRPVHFITYPAQFILQSLDQRDPPEDGAPSALLLLVAKRPETSTG